MKAEADGGSSPLEPGGKAYRLQTLSPGARPYQENDTFENSSSRDNKYSPVRERSVQTHKDLGRWLDEAALWEWGMH
jgi:hypothetical protein